MIKQAPQQQMEEQKALMVGDMSLSLSRSLILAMSTVYLIFFPLNEPQQKSMLSWTGKFSACSCQTEVTKYKYLLTLLWQIFQVFQLTFSVFCFLTTDICLQISAFCGPYFGKTMRVTFVFEKNKFYEKSFTCDIGVVA